MDFFKEIDRETQKWKEEVLPKFTTFSEVPLGEEFYDEWDNLWEKRTDKRAISWIEGEKIDMMEFGPDDRVRMK